MRQIDRLSPEDAEDIVRVAMIDLAAVPTQKYSESRYLRRVTSNAARTHLAKIRKTWNTVPLDGYPMNIFLVDPAAGAVIEQVDARVLADQLLDQATPLQRRLIKRMLGMDSDDAVKPHELARAEHMSLDRVRVQLNAGMTKMRRVAMAAAASN